MIQRVLPEHPTAARQSDMKVPALIAILLACALSPPAGLAESYSPAALEDITEKVNSYIQSKLDDAEVAAVPTAKDSVLLRRVTLDLAGRIPLRSEIDAYDQLPDDRRFGKTVERLVKSPDFDFHLRNELDILLLARLRNDDAWRKYLLWAVRENRGWDKIFTDVMLPDPKHEHRQHAALFLRERVRDIEKMTNDTAVLFFGVNIGCAQCHDHPLVLDWEQKHFYGMKSFFNRTYRTKKDTLAEKFEGIVKYKTVSGEEHEAEFMFLNSQVVTEPKIEKTDEQRKAEQEEVKKQMREKDAPPARVPAFSPRAQLVELALETDDRQQNFLARSIVNRTWARLMGYGLVEPLDQMHSENPASHPELLDFLARDFIEHGYDLRRLIGCIVLSDPYRRSSQWYSDEEPPASEHFAMARTRPLTPRQLSLSLLIATTDPEWFARDEVKNQWGQKREELESRSNGLANLLEIPDERFQVSVDEALLFSNASRVQNDYLRTGNDRLIGVLQKLRTGKAQTEESSSQQEPVIDSTVVDQAFLVILGRLPDEAESQLITKHLRSRPRDNAAAVQNVVWALLTSPEFRFNH